MTRVPLWLRLLTNPRPYLVTLGVVTAACCGLKALLDKADRIEVRIGGDES